MFFSESGNVILKNYEPTFEGLIQSWVERYPSLSTSDNLIKLSEKDEAYFAPLALKN